MNTEQQRLIAQNFAAIAPQAEAVAAAFYARLFALDPALKPLFKGDMQAQGAKLINMIAIAVRHVDRLHEVAPALADLGRRHRAYGVLDAHYDTVARALLDTLASGLGADFTPAARAAWGALYASVARAMRDGETT